MTASQIPIWKKLLKEDVVPFLLPFIVIIGMGVGAVSFMGWDKAKAETKVEVTMSPSPTITPTATPSATPTATPSATPVASPKVIKVSIKTPTPVNLVPRSEIDKMVCSVFTGNLCSQALSIMVCESGGNPEKVNYNDAKITGFNSYGLFQINGSGNWSWNNPMQNILAAKTKYDHRKWSPWHICAKKNGLL